MSSVKSVVKKNKHTQQITFTFVILSKTPLKGWGDLLPGRHGFPAHLKRLHRHGMKLEGHARVEHPEAGPCFLHKEKNLLDRQGNAIY